MGIRFADEADYADRSPTMIGWLDRLLAGEVVSNFLFLLMLSGCCFVAPLSGVLGGLGLMVCHSPEARHNATFLSVAAGAHGAIFLFVVVTAGLVRVL